MATARQRGDIRMVGAVIDFHYARNRRPVYEAAHAKYGMQAQCSKAIEELAECTIELSRMFTDRFDRERLVEELADAICVLEQMAMLMDDRMEKNVADTLATKVERLKGRVEDGNV